MKTVIYNNYCCRLIKVSFRLQIICVGEARFGRARDCPKSCWGMELGWQGGQCSRSTFLSSTGEPGHQQRTPQWGGTESKHVHSEDCKQVSNELIN